MVEHQDHLVFQEKPRNYSEEDHMDLFLPTKEIQGEHLVLEDLLHQTVLQKTEVCPPILEILKLK